MEDKQNKVTKKESSEYLKSLIRNAVPKSLEELSRFATQSFHFLAENYSNLDNEMQAIADKMYDELKKHFDVALKEAPDTEDIRNARRLLRAIKYELPSASLLIKALESKREVNEPAIIETRQLFEKYFQAFLDFLYDVSMEESHQGVASFAKLSLLYSVVDELLAAFHMAQHGYINQAYAHIRTIYESFNQIELFIRDEQYAELWFSDDEKKKMNKLKPAAVRKKLGIQEDPLYAFFSAHGSHVTKEYVQSRSVRKRKLSEKGNPEIHLYIGGTGILPHLLWANMACMVALFGAFVHLHKAFPNHVHEQDYPALCEAYAKDFMGYLKRFIEFTKETGINAEEIDDLVNKMDQLLRATKPS
ncbi:MAG: hypothetical protein ACLP9S_05205 [Syntrophales bacterium]